MKRAFRAGFGRVSGVMLRFKVMASVLPLAFAAAFAKGALLPGPRACIEIGGAAVQIAPISSLADHHVSFTDDPRLATVRVQITDNAEAADFTVVDDIDDAEAGACEGNTVPQLVAIASSPSATEPVIYLTESGPADYRIFVRSKSFSPREAAALIVGAHGGHGQLQAASL